MQFSILVTLLALILFSSGSMIVQAATTIAVNTTVDELNSDGDCSLREAVVADRDFPPYDRVMMDGIAIASASLQEGLRQWQLQGSQAAGEPSLSLKDKSCAIGIATGAMLPDGCDTVIPSEVYDELDGAVALHDGETVEAGQYIHRKGSDRLKGDVLIEVGTCLTAKELGVCAACGVGRISVSARPKVAVAVTGDELLAVDDVPKAWQQRRSNDQVITAFLDASACEMIQLICLPDNLEATTETFKELLPQLDVLITSGGVSKGDHDFVRPALESLGVDILFHRVEQRPGHPLLFAVSQDKTLVFGLPGNPLAVLSVLHKCVDESLRVMSGEAEQEPLLCAIDESFTCRGASMYYVPARLTQDTAGLFRANVPKINNSGDIAGVLGTDGFLSIDGTEKKTYDSGSLLPFTYWK